MKNLILFVFLVGCAPARSAESEPVVVGVLDEALLRCATFTDYVTDVVVYESGLMSAVDPTGAAVWATGCSAVEVSDGG